MPNLLSAAFINYGPVQGLKKITIQQSVGKHSLALLDYEFRRKSQYILPDENTPFVANFGVAPLGVRRFYGYVNHYETLSSADGVGTQLVGLGTSKVFNSATPSNWSSFTRSGVVRELAKRHRMRSIIHAHPDVMDNWATGTMTDFQAVRTLADEAGYYSWIDGGTVYFLDPRRLLAGAASLDIPRFTRAQITDSTIVAGTNAPRDGDAARRQVVYGLDNSSNEFITATYGAVTLPTTTLNTPVSSYREAATVTKSNRNREDVYYTLTANVSGNARVQPNSLILMAKDDVSSDRVGYWLVSEVKHEITEESFSTKIVASRTSDGTPSLSAPSVLLNTRERSAAVVRDGTQWEAEVQEHVNV